MSPRLPFFPTSSARQPQLLSHDAGVFLFHFWGDTPRVVVPRWEAADSHPHKHSAVIRAADSPHLPCFTPHSLVSNRAPRHLFFPPTSPLPHQDHPNISPRCFLKLPWVRRPHAQIMLACSGGAGQRGREWVRRTETESALFSFRVTFLAKTAFTSQRLALSSELRQLLLYMPVLAADLSPIPQPHQGTGMESKFRKPDSLQWFNIGASPKYIVLGLYWWMDNQILLTVCNKTYWFLHGEDRSSMVVNYDVAKDQEVAGLMGDFSVIANQKIYRCLKRKNHIAGQVEKMSLSGPSIPPAEPSGSGWEEVLGRNLQVLVEVITLVSLHLICSLTDFQTVEWVNKVPQGTPAGAGLPRGGTHKRSWNPATRCEPQTKGSCWTTTREPANFINPILDWASCHRTRSATTVCRYTLRNDRARAEMNMNVFVTVYKHIFLMQDFACVLDWMDHIRRGTHAYLAVEAGPQGNRGPRHSADPTHPGTILPSFWARHK